MVLILTAAARTAAAWKNGGGVTREVAVHPAGSDLGSFEWRVSIAQVHRGGPFSVFPGVDRHMAVLAGRLAFAIEGRTLSLTPDSAPLAFGGELPVHAQPDGATATDLNIMVRRGRWRARLTRCGVAEARVVALAADTTILIALAPLSVMAQGTRCDMAPLDALRLEDVAQCEVSAAAAPGGDDAFYLAGISRAR